MLTSEFLHLVNKYGADLKSEDAELYHRDACKCAWGVKDTPEAYTELEARLDDYVHYAFPNMDIGKREKLRYVLTQCIAFEIGIIPYPDEKDVSYPGVGIIAESTIAEGTSRPVYKPFRSPNNITFEYSDIYSYVSDDGTELDFKYTIKPTVYLDGDDSEYDGFDDADIQIDISEDKQQYIPEIKEKLVDIIDNDPELQSNICVAANEHIGEMADNYDNAYDQAVDAWLERERD